VVLPRPLLHHDHDAAGHRFGVYARGAAETGLQGRHRYLAALRVGADVHAGIAAWQANNLDSAIASFRRASAMLPAEPTGIKYIATLFYNTGKADSAVMYFRRPRTPPPRIPSRSGPQRRALQPRPHSASLQQPAEARRPIGVSGLFPNDAEIMPRWARYMQKAAKDSTYREQRVRDLRQIISRATRWVFPALSGRRRKSPGASLKIPHPRSRHNCRRESAQSVRP